jgi:hypothetical protein
MSALMMILLVVCICLPTGCGDVGDIGYDNDQYSQDSSQDNDSEVSEDNDNTTITNEDNDQTSSNDGNTTTNGQ